MHVQVSDELPAWTTPVITAELIMKYAVASGDLNPIHTDPEAARCAGHRDVIAHGMWSMAQLANLVQHWAGTNSVRESKVRFVGVVSTGDQLTCRGRVAEILESGVAVVEAWTEGPDGRRATEGSFTVELRTAG